MNWRLSLRNLFGPTRRLVVLFLVLTLAPASALVWFGWRQFKQDRTDEARRIHDRREQAATLIVTALGQALAAADQRLADPSSWNSLPGDAWIVAIGAHTIQTYPEIRLPYYPFRAVLPESPDEPFRAAENDEYRLHDYVHAIEKLRDLANSTDAAVRAGAQLLLARNLRKAGQLTEALDVYSELAREANVAVSDGLPADLVARHARCQVLAQLDRTAELRRDAAQLDTDLRSGRWQLDRGTQRNYLEELKPWTGREADSHRSESEREPVAAVVYDIWSKWNDATGRDRSNFSGRATFPVQGGFGTVIWRASAEGLAVLAAGPRFLEDQWMAPLGALAETQRVRVVLRDSEGHLVFGKPSADGDFKTVRADAGLPWRLEIESVDPQADLAQAAASGRLVLAGLGLLLIVVAAGSYFVARAFMREMAVVRLQSDFVAAVSHEFRTPLTSLNQITELLIDGRVEDRGLLFGYYQKQARATARLQRLVESLLDFGRMEAGAKPYRMEPLDAARWVHSVVEDFQVEAAASGYQIELNTNGGGARIHADPDALSHALRNLLDNAVKYSPDCRTVWVDLAHIGGRIAIRVRDQGLGIPADEQKQIFRKFVRGAASKANGIKGTGVGLAMVDHIVKAHGGEVILESEPGKGSTFTVLL